MKRISFFVLTLMMLLLAGCGSTTYNEEHNSQDDYEAGITKPSVTVESSCGLGTSRGSYTVSSSEYGVLCSGRGYSDKETAIRKPLEIKSEGCEMSITLADDSIETVYMNAGDSQLISCDSGNFKGYLYVIVT